MEFFQDLQEELELLQNNYKGRKQGLLEDIQQKFATADSGISTMEWYHLNVIILSFSKKKRTHKNGSEGNYHISRNDGKRTRLLQVVPLQPRFLVIVKVLNQFCVLLDLLCCFQSQKKRIDNCDYENTPDTASQAKTKLLLTDSRPPPVTSNICAHRPSFPY